MDPIGRNTGILYPLLIVVAVSTIIFGVFGVATLTGILPHADAFESSKSPLATLSIPERFGTPATDCGIGARC